MKILMVGSFKAQTTAITQAKESQNHDLNRFIDACTSIGAAIAEKEHTLIIGSPKYEDLKTGHSAITYAIEGANSVPCKEGGKKHTVILYLPQEHEPADDTRKKVDSVAELEQMQNIQIERRFIHARTIHDIPGRDIEESGDKDIPSSTVIDISDIDAAILIGGGKGTAAVGYFVYAIKKPLIAITGFEGSAELLARDVLREYYEYFTKKGHITTSQFSVLDCHWDVAEKSERNQQNAQKIIHLVEKLAQHDAREQKDKSKPLWLAMGLIPILLVAWLSIYLSGASLSPMSKSYTIFINILFFGSLYISAILGAGLRLLTDYQDNRIARLTYTSLGIDISISLLLAFALVLVYLIGSISFTGGKVVILSQENQAFTTVAISMSLLGLTSGYLLPLNQLRVRLNKLITENTTSR